MTRWCLQEVRAASPSYPDMDEARMGGMAQGRVEARLRAGHEDCASRSQHNSSTPSRGGSGVAPQSLHCMQVDRGRKTAKS